MVFEDIKKKVNGFFIALSLCYGYNGLIKSYIKVDNKEYTIIKKGDKRLYAMQVVIGKGDYNVYSYSYSDCKSNSKLNYIGLCKVYIHNTKIYFYIPFIWIDYDDLTHVRIYDIF